MQTFTELGETMERYTKSVITILLITLSYAVADIVKVKSLNDLSLSVISKRCAILQIKLSPQLSYNSSVINSSSSCPQEYVVEATQSFLPEREWQCWTQLQNASNSNPISVYVKVGKSCMLNVQDAEDAAKVYKVENEFEQEQFQQPLKSWGLTTCECRGTVGVIHSPYDKLPESCSPSDQQCRPPYKQQVPWTNYTESEILNQLRLIRTRFSELSTYGIGTRYSSEDKDSFNSDWRDGLPVAYIPISVAKLNKESNARNLTLIAGAYFHEGYPLEQIRKEINNTISAARDAEAVFPRSISGVSIQYDPKTMRNEPFFSLVKDGLKSAKTYSSEGKVGLRIQNCLESGIEQFTRVEEITRLYCLPTDTNCTQLNPLKLDESLELLVTESDFVICLFHPEERKFFSTPLPDSMNQTVANLGVLLTDLHRAYAKVNPKIDFILETGWPSQGIYNVEVKVPSRPELMETYHLLMTRFAVEKGLRLLILEAFDQHWKTRLTSQGELNETDGVCGAKGSYGLWARKDNSYPPEYEEKIVTWPEDFEEDILDVSLMNDGGQFPPDCNLTNPMIADQQNSGNSSLLPGILGSTSVLLIIVLVILVYLVVRNRWMSRPKIDKKYQLLFHQGKDPEKPVENGEESDYQVIALHFPYNKKLYELDKGSFNIDYSEPLGKGQSGTVYLGTILGREENVAFKSTSSLSSITDIKNLLAEIKIMSYVGQHENIICLIGAHTEKLEKGIVHVALEYCILGSLEKFFKEKGSFKQGGSGESGESGYSSGASLVPTLESNLDLHYVQASYFQNANDQPSRSGSESSLSLDTAKIDFDFQDMLSWVLGIADGLDHLASKKVVHADLACRNILLTATKTVKITDFGLSRKMYSEIDPSLIFDSEVPLPWRWMAPESLRKLTFSSHSDVWSFGVTVWEIFTLGDIPYGGYSFGNQFVSELEAGLRLTEPDLAPNAILDLLSSCWDLSPQNRPNPKTVKASLQKIVQEYAHSQP